MWRRYSHEIIHTERLDRNNAAGLPRVEVLRPLISSSTAEAEDLPLILHHFSYWPGWQKNDDSISFLSALLQQSGPNSPLTYACKAIARAYFSNRRPTADNRSMEVTTYGKALAATNAALRSPGVCAADDGILASVFLLGLHEVRGKDKSRDSICLWWLMVMIVDRWCCEFQNFPGACHMGDTRKGASLAAAIESFKPV